MAKEFECDEKEIMEFLHSYYEKEFHPEPTYAEVFQELQDYKANQLNRSDRSIYAYENIFHRFTTEAMAKKKIAKITEDMLLLWVKDQVKATRPKPEAFRKWVQQIKGIFDFAIRKKYCTGNPSAVINIHDYLKDCDSTRKAAEDKEFSKEELQKLWDFALTDTKNPRTLMMMMAILLSLILPKVKKNKIIKSWKILMIF